MIIKSIVVMLGIVWTAFPSAVAAEPECTAFVSDFNYSAIGGRNYILADGVYGCQDIDILSFRQNYLPELADESGSDQAFADFLKLPEFIAMTLVATETETVKNHARSVGRLAIKLRQKATSQNSPAETFVNWCTATVISPRHLITAHHCIPGKDSSLMVAEAQVRFDYLEQESDRSTIYRVNPKPILANPELDFAVLTTMDGEITDRPAVKLGAGAIITRKELEAHGKGEPNLLIVHHPLAQPLRLSRKGCHPFAAENIARNGSTLKHICATFPISSGAMVTDEEFKPVAIHFAGVESTDADQIRDGAFNYNSSTLLEVILERFREVPELQLAFGLDPIQSSINSQQIVTESGERPALQLEIAGNKINLGFWGFASSSVAYLYLTDMDGAGPSRNVRAEGRTSIEEFCNLENFRTTVNWGAPISEGEFAVLTTPEGRRIVLKLEKLEAVDGGKEFQVTYRYWVASNSSITNFAGASETSACNNTQFDVVKLDELKYENDAYGQTAALNFHNYEDGQLRIGDGKSLFVVDVSGAATNSVYFYNDTDSPEKRNATSEYPKLYEKIDVMNTTEFAAASSFMIDDRLEKAPPPKRATVLNEGETLLLKKGNGWIGAVSARRVMHEKSILVFDIWFSNKPFSGKEPIVSNLASCAAETLMTSSCDSHRSIAGYINAAQ